MAKVAITNQTSSIAIVHYLSEAEARAYIDGYRQGREGMMDNITIKLDGKEV